MCYHHSTLTVACSLQLLNWHDPVINAAESRVCIGESQEFPLGYTKPPSNLPTSSSHCTLVNREISCSWNFYRGPQFIAFVVTHTLNITCFFINYFIKWQEGKPMLLKTPWHHLCSGPEAGTPGIQGWVPLQRCMVQAGMGPLLQRLLNCASLSYGRYSVCENDLGDKLQYS